MPKVTGYFLDMANYSTHSFSVALATQLGLHEAIVLQYFYYWHTLNTGNAAMQENGRTWFFKSAAKIQQVFPYLTERKIRTAVEHLVEDGYILKEEGQGYNRSTRYSFTDLGLALYDEKLDASNIMSNPSYEMSNGCIENVESIVNNKDINKKIVRDNNNIKEKKFDFRASLINIGVSEETADAWMQVRKAKKAVNTELAFNEIHNEIMRSGYAAEDCIRTAAVNSWRGFKADWMLNAQEERKEKVAPKRKESTFEKNLRTIDEMMGTNYHEQYYGNK